MDLLETEHEDHLRREAVAERLRALADALARHNSVEVTKGGTRFTIKVPDEVTYSFEVEITDEGGEIEVEISW